MNERNRSEIKKKRPSWYIRSLNSLPHWSSMRLFDKEQPDPRFSTWLKEIMGSCASQTMTVTPTALSLSGHVLKKMVRMPRTGIEVLSAPMMVVCLFHIYVGSCALNHHGQTWMVALVSNIKLLSSRVEYLVHCVVPTEGTWSETASTWHDFVLNGTACAVEGAVDVEGPALVEATDETEDGMHLGGCDHCWADNLEDFHRW